MISRFVLVIVVALAYTAPALAQHAHSQPPPAPAKPSTNQPGETGGAGDPHAGHGQPPPQAPGHPTPDPKGQDEHDEHDHSMHQPVPSGQEHAGHDHPAGQDVTASRADAEPLPPFIPPITDADRAAAFPDVMGHSVHDNAINYLVLFDQLEWRGGNNPAGVWHTLGWVGRDVDRLWFRSEGTGQEGGLHHAEAQVFYGRAIRRWWDVVAGVRQDFGEGPNRTWAGVGLQGLAPYWFEVQATAYVGESGRTHLRFETEYEFLLTNRLILQPVVEMDFYGKGDAARRLGAGLSAMDAGLRLRYEFRREFAPYVGVTWDSKFFGTADLARSAGERTSGARLAVGLRLWL